MIFKKKNITRIQGGETGPPSGFTRDINRIKELIHLFSSTSQEESILERLINSVTTISQASAGSVILFDPSNQRSAKTLIHDHMQENDLLDHYLNLLLAGWVAEHGVRLLTSDLRQTYDPKILGKKYREITSALSVPLMADKKIIGAVNLIKTAGKESFTSWHITVIETLAALCIHFIQNNRLREKMFAETERLRKETQRIYSYEGLIGRSPKMVELYKLLEKIIPTTGRVVIEGESGTGKELVARILHYNGPLKNNPFIAIDCGVLPANLLESELFGHVKGAFTGASSDKMGLFEEADTGTLFLDEIVNMPLDMQSKLLRVIQEKEFRPVGSTQLKKVNIRIIVAASCSLAESVNRGLFREDLYYRLNVVKISLPPLRERVEDIVILADHFLNKLDREYKKNIDRFDGRVLRAFEAYHWPGNVRELENVIERMIILAEPGARHLTFDLLPEEITGKSKLLPEPGFSGSSLDKIKDRRTFAEKSAFLEILEKHNWNQSSAARELGIHESSLRY
ncbi:MAG: sigma-54-dependent Fis family transcriptional regulator, partial [Calditrichia bacterium]